MLKVEPLDIVLSDSSWPYIKTTHDRLIVRAVIYDNDHNFYCVHVNRDDQFGKVSFLETSGGGVEEKETLEVALKRELKEELGMEVEIITYLGLVSDYYNLIYRHNLNNYFLVKVIKIGENHLTNDEINDFHLKMFKGSYEELVKNYEDTKETKLGKLIYNREMPVISYAYRIIKDFNL